MNSQQLELPLRDQRALAKVLTALTRTGCTATSVRANFGDQSAVITIEGSPLSLRRLSVMVSRLISTHHEEYR